MNNKEKETIQLKLKEARGQISQEILGDRLNIRQHTISRWEKGQGLPNQLLLFKRFCEETGANPLWILGMDEKS
jgi:DNA-binding XRE family transcriptional regulator